MATEGERTAPTSCLSAAACPRMALSTRPHATLASRSAAAGARRELCTLSPACLPAAADQRAGDVWAHGEKGRGARGGGVITHMACSHQMMPSSWHSWPTVVRIP